MRALLVIVAVTSLAHADVQRDVDQGARLYERGELDAAIAVLERANAVEVTAKGCYVLGQAWRKKGDCRRAIPNFRCAVEHVESEKRGLAATDKELAALEKLKLAANFQIGRCVVDNKFEPEAQPEQILVPVDRVVVKPAPPSPWYRDTAGGILFGVGLGAAGVGGGLLVHAELRAQGASDDLQSFRDASNVGTERFAGTVSLAVGGVLLVGSIVRYAVVARR